MRLSNKRGFTLIELIVVIVIIGILAAVAVPAFVDLVAQAQAGATQGALGGIRSAVVVDRAGRIAKNPTDTVWPANIIAGLFEPPIIPPNACVATQFKTTVVATSAIPDAATCDAASATSAWIYNNANGGVWAAADTDKDAWKDVATW